MRFTLLRRPWYAAEFIGDEFGEEVRSYSPIRVDELRPHHGTQRRFELSFYHANYPDGVREKTYTLQTIERGERFLLARSEQHSPPRLLLIYAISWPWLGKHFGISPRDTSSEVADWLLRSA